MSAVDEKKTEAGHPPPIQQPNWYGNGAMNMFNIFNPYNMYPQGYGGQNPYYQYYPHQGMQQQAYMNSTGQQPMQTNDDQYRNFTSGGHLMPFQQTLQHNQQLPVQQAQTPNAAPIKPELNDDLPPLPPGPPPNNSSPNNSGNTAQTNSFSSNAVIQAGPVKFMMNTPRPRMNLQGNAFTQPQQTQQQQAPSIVGGSSRSRRKKKRKLLQQQARQQLLMDQAQYYKNRTQKPQNQQMADAPPLPEAPPPPLPPGSPPALPPPPVVNEVNENHSGANNINMTKNINLPPSAPPGGLQPYQGPLAALPSAAQVQTQGIKALDDWPTTLRDYVSRCYAKCVNQLDKDRVGMILKGKIMRATSDGTLWTKDWGDEPLPLLESDNKAVMNLKEKWNKTSIASRLGPKTASPPRNNKRPTPSSRSTARGRSASSSSRSSSPGRWSRSRSPRPKKTRTPTKKSKGNNNRRGNHYSKSHFYSEFGVIGGGSEDVKKEVLDKRAARFSTSSSSTKSSQPTVSSAVVKGGNNSKESGGNRKRQSSAFVYDYGPGSPQGSTSNAGSSGGGNGDYEVSDLHIIGTCEDLEKAYLRLTSAPEASQVRPRNVLVKSLEMVKAKWIKDRDYHYAFEQLKSIRQDLTVQGIRDSLSVNVYETHARIALEMKDHAEFNQCQSQLKILHEEVTDAAENKLEFKAYAILFFILTKDCMELSTLLSSVTKEDKEDPCIRHAVELAHAWLVGTHVRIFKLYRTAPKMSSYLIDLFINRERLVYFKVLIKAYRPSIPLDFVKSELELDTDSDVEAFLTSVGNVSYADSSRTLIDCKASQG